MRHILNKLWLPMFFAGAYLMLSTPPASAEDQGTKAVCMGVIYTTGCCDCDDVFCTNSSSAGDYTCGGGPGMCVEPQNNCPAGN